jgi:hypothetical protein
MVRRHAALALVIAIARDQLTAAGWATLDIASENVQLPLHHTAVMARDAIGTPIFGFLAVPNPHSYSASDLYFGLKLVCLNSLRPTLDHSDAVVDDVFLLLIFTHVA